MCAALRFVTANAPLEAPSWKPPFLSSCGRCHKYEFVGCAYKGNRWTVNHQFMEATALQAPRTFEGAHTTSEGAQLRSRVSG